MLFSGHILNTILILDVFITRCEFILHWILQGLLATWTSINIIVYLNNSGGHFLDYFKKNKTHIFLPFTPVISFINISQTYIMSRTQTLSTAHLVSMINSIQVTSMCSLSPTNINTYDFLSIFSQVPLLSVIAFLSLCFDLQSQPLHSHDILKVSSKFYEY